MTQNADSSTRHGWLHLGVRGKVAVILFATLLVSLTATSLLTLHAQKQDILEETDRRTRETAQFIAQYLAYSVVAYDYHTLELHLQELTRGHDITYARVENTMGNAMAMAGVPPIGGATPLHTTEIRLNGELLGRLVMSQSTVRITETLAMRQRELFFGQMLVVLVVLTVGFAALSRYIIRPLSVIVGTIRRNTSPDATHLARIDLDADDEFGELARGFNALGRRLDQARDKLTSRIDAADQELREAYEQLERQATALRAMNRDLEQQNITDPLTGLYNRRYFDGLMQHEVEKFIRSDETLSILLIDIDGYQAMLESLGHAGGDEVIKGVGRIIAQHTRAADVACRYSSSEFVVFCRRATIANAIAIADNIQDAVAAESFVVRDQSQPVRISVGVATIPGVHRVASAAEFFRCAENALRYSRQHHGGVIHYSMLDHQPGTALL